MRRLVFEWLPFIGALMVYDTARAGASVFGRHVVVTQQIHADKFLFLGTVPTVALQRHFLHVQPHWWDVAAALIYVTHFFAVFVLAGWLWSRDRQAWGAFATRFFLLVFRRGRDVRRVPDRAAVGRFADGASLARDPQRHASGGARST